MQEYWCKRLHPKNVCEKVFRQPPLRDSLKKGKLRKQDFSVTKHKTSLLQVADSIGKKIQYDCPGFLPNRRQVNIFKNNTKLLLDFPPYFIPLCCPPLVSLLAPLIVNIPIPLSLGKYFSCFLNLTGLM